MKKTCIKCQIEKKLAEFSKRKISQNRLQGWCKKCSNEAAKNYRDTHQEQMKQYHKQYRTTHKKQRAAQQRFLKYNITSNELNQIFLKQGKKCAICNSVEPKTKKGWSVDHNHKTGEVRGVLCQPCNSDLAPIENLEWKTNAEKYLKLYFK